LSADVWKKRKINRREASKTSPRIKFARRRAIEFRNKMSINYVPIDILSIYEKNGWEFNWSDKVRGDSEAVTYHWNGFYATYLPENFKINLPSRFRWTMGHEIGHIVLKHYEEFPLSFSNCSKVGKDLIKTLNREANLFCDEFLMPAKFIYENYRMGFDYLKSSFEVSRQALEIRLKDMGFNINGNYLELRWNYGRNGYAG